MKILTSIRIQSSNNGHDGDGLHIKFKDGKLLLNTSYSDVHESQFSLSEAREIADAINELCGSSLFREVDNG